jgi:hypothetical protein
MFASYRIFRSWNGRYAGKPAGSVMNKGYVVIVIQNGHFLAHRLVWLLRRGEPVPDEIDHRNGDRTDNRISNLREATRSDNNANARKPSHNTTGVKGICRSRGAYLVQVKSGGTRYRREFRTLKEAVAARRKAATRLHGAFARHE